MSQASAYIPTYVLTSDGLRPTDYRVSSLTESIEYEPRGVYTVARTFFGNRALLFDAHLDRLEQSSHLVDIPLVLDREKLRAALRELIQQAGYADTKLRITVPYEDANTLYLAIEPFVPVPEAIMQGGAHVITVPIMRENPDVKTTEWMSVRRPTYESLPPGVYEGVMVTAEGLVLEGLSSNVYGVLDGVLRTAGSGVLAGITRRAIYEFGPTVLPVVPEPLHVSNLPDLTEAILTSSGRGVVPITVINGNPVGDGQVGPIVQRLQQLYDEWTELHSEPI